MQWVSFRLATIMLFCVVVAPRWTYGEVPGVDARACEILEHLADHLANLPSLQVMAKTRIVRGQDDVRAVTEFRQLLVFQRNTGIAIRTLPSSAPTPEVYYRDSKGTMIIPGVGVVSSTARDMAGFFRSSRFGYERSEEGNPLTDQSLAIAMVRELLIPQSNERWDDDILDFQRIGSEVIDGQTVHQIRIRQKTKDDDSIETDFWITEGQQPRLIRFRPNADQLSNEEMRIEIDCYLEDWNASPTITENTFRPNTEGLATYRSVRQAFRNIVGAGNEEKTRRELVGKTAPHFKVRLQNGGEFDLGNHVGKQLIVLDFWATWCDPAIRGFWEWDEIISGDQERRIVYLAVNQGQDLEQIDDFLSEADGLPEFQVAVDPERKVGELFSVEGLPETIIIGLDGRIKDVQFGLNAGNRASIRSTVYALAGVSEFGPVETIDELKQRQDRIREVVERVEASVVGLQAGRGAGSGVVVSKDGLILTAAHVTSRIGQEFAVMFPNGRQVRGVSLGLNRTRDAAMIRIEDPGEYPFVEVAEPSPKLGQWVISMGHPDGFSLDRSAPVRVGRIVKLPDAQGRGQGFLATDCTITMGDSGGPLFDLDGRVVGIHSFISGRLIENMHVPVAVYQDDWQRYLDADDWGNGIGGQADRDRPVVGIKLANVNDQVVVELVADGYPAQKAGLEVGDIVKSVGDRQQIQSIGDYRVELAKYNVGDEIKVVIQRGEEVLDKTIVLAERD
ncbi:MAG: trypsin-like peptidase domain-containing protein [Pirellulaceae bacterium]